MTSSSANTILLLRDIGFWESEALMNSLFPKSQAHGRNFFAFQKKRVLFVILEDQKGLGKQKHANYDFECSISMFFFSKAHSRAPALARAINHSCFRSKGAFEWKIKGSFWVRLLKGHLRIIFHEPKLFAKGSRAYMSDANV